MEQKTEVLKGSEFGIKLFIGGIEVDSELTDGRPSMTDKAEQDQPGADGEGVKVEADTAADEVDAMAAKARQYTLLVGYKDDITNPYHDNGWYAFCWHIPTCCSYGHKTLQEAIDRVYSALAVHIKYREQIGHSAPDPDVDLGDVFRASNNESLEAAIHHSLQVANHYATNDGHSRDHHQLADWLIELKCRREHEQQKKRVNFQQSVSLSIDYQKELVKKALEMAAKGFANSVRGLHVTMDLHAQCAHPDYEYVTTRGPREAFDELPPEGKGWIRNIERGKNGWDRFEYHEEAYWRRLKLDKDDATQNVPELTEKEINLLRRISDGPLIVSGLSDFPIFVGLMRKGLAEPTDAGWAITDVGREALKRADSSWKTDPQGNQ